MSPTVHHYESNYDWKDEMGLDRIPEGDIVIAPDAQGRLGQPTFCVIELDSKDAIERIVQRGLFWKVGEARRYAKALASESNQVI